MVHVITPANRYLYVNELEEMYRLRYDVAVNELGWSIPNVGEKHDKDNYDYDNTIYFLERNGAGHLIATARLNPTAQPHLMTDVFSELCEFDGVPIGPDIYEYSRFLVKRNGVNRKDNLRAQAHISLAIVEYCLAAGIKQVSWVSYKRSYPLALRMWKTRPLGLPQYFESDDAHYIAAISDMTEESLRRTRELAHIQEPVCRITLPLDAAPDIAKPPRTALTA